MRLVGSLTAALLCLGALCWVTYRDARQEQRNRRLILAIKRTADGHSQAAEVLACLQAGADPNARDDSSWRVSDADPPLALRPALLHALQHFRTRFRGGDTNDKDPDHPMQSALFLALEGEIADRTACFEHYADPAIVKLLVQYGADVR